MKANFIEYNDNHESVLTEMIYGLYTEDPEGEPMNSEKIAATIEQSERFRDRLRIYIFEVDNEAAGYAIVQLTWSNEWGGLTANIDEMYVIKPRRNQGLATGFIRNLPEMLTEINRVTLEVTPSNDKAMAFYEALGFRQAENRFMEK